MEEEVKTNRNISEVGSETKEETGPASTLELCSYLRSFLTVVVLGASGDLAKKKTFPALFDLYENGFMPPKFAMYGYARSNMSDEQLRDRVKPFLLEVADNSLKVDSFLQKLFYKSGDYGSVEAMQKLIKHVEEVESIERSQASCDSANRMFYFAIPPDVFIPTAYAIKKVGISTCGWTRLIVEKPFGHDLESAKELSDNLSKHFDEHFIYRIDHYLGKEMVQNLLVMRFSNALFEPVWSREHISSVMFTFKENFGVEGRGGYFDKSGIIRDIIQNHLIQVFSLIAMAPPVRISGEDYSFYVRNSKVEVLKSVEPINFSEVVIGQYVGNDQMNVTSYLDDPTVPAGSHTPTFATVVLRINNRRWEGVPFIFKAGKALNERKAEESVRIQFRKPPGASFMFDKRECPQNELVLRLQPNESTYLKMNIKAPGLLDEPIQSEMDLSYKERYPSAYSPDAYTRLILEVMRGNQAAFVRNDELLASWEIFTPLLEAIESGQLGEPLPYVYGSRGPIESDQLISRLGYKYNHAYKWKKPLSRH